MSDRGITTMTVGRLSNESRDEAVTRLTLVVVAALIEATDPLEAIADEGLGALVEGLSADGAIVQLESGLTSCPTVDVAVARDGSRPSTPIDARELPATWTRLLRRQTVAATDVHALGNGWERDRRMLTGAGVRSIALAPVACDDEIVGVVGLTMATEPRRWSDAELAALRLVSATLGSALARARATDELRAHDHLFRAMVESSFDLLVSVSPEGETSFVSPAVEHMLGYRPEEMLGAGLLDLVHPDDLDPVLQKFDTTITTGEVGDPIVLRIRHADGTWRWLEAVGTNLLDDPEVGAVLVNIRDVTRRLEAERDAATERARYRQLVEAIPDGVVRVDRQLRPVYANAAARALQDAWVGGSSAFPEGYESRPDDLDQAVGVLRDALATGQPSAFETMTVIDGEERWYHVSVKPETDDDGPDAGVTGLLTVMRDITVWKTRERELTRQALEDPLTGLANRARFELELDRAIDSVSRGTDPVGILFVDLDGFKEVNDLLGHAVGDQFLEAFAESFRNAVRPSDLIARVGGDEFVVLPSRLRVAAELVELAERLHAALEQPLTVGPHQMCPSISIGIASVRAGTEVDAEQLIERADRAMYRAKRLGPGQTSVWSPDT